MQTIKVAILGQTGRVGRMIQENLPEHEDMKFVGGINHTSSAAEYKSVFEAADVLIDFSHAGIASKHLHLAQEHKTPIVMGTTGLSQNDLAVFDEVSKIIPCLYAPNMSTGITLLLHLVERAAQSLEEEFDIEIHENHHRHKADAPSGTSLNLGKAAARGRGKDFDTVKQLHWETGIPRKRGMIGFSASRGGEVIGDHAVRFFGPNEVVEISHHAQNRMIYAEGALKAARWLITQKPGLYSMREVLGI